MSDQKSPSSQPGLRKWLGPLLLISLVLNLFLGAHFAVGMARHFGHEAHEGGVMLGLPHGAVIRSLNAEERRLLRELMRPQRIGLADQFQNIRAARLALADAVAAMPYDPARVEQAFAEMREAMGSVAETSQNALTRAFAELSPETRARIATALRQPRPGRERFEHHRNQEDDRD